MREQDERGTLLLVEDDPDHAFLVRRQLADHGGLGLRVEHASTAAGAARRLAEPGIRCVVLDLSLPDARGLAALEALRAVDPSVPVVVLTGLDSDAIGLQALQCGAQDYLVKGQHAGDALGRSVMFAMERARREDAERRQATLGDQLAVREAQLSEAQRLARLGSWERDVATGQVAWSHELQRLTGITDVGDTRAFQDYLQRVPEVQRAEVGRLFDLDQADDEPFAVRHQFECDGGPSRWVLGHMTAAAWDENGAPVRVLGTMQDITEQKDAEDRLAHQALHDSLTGLVNRGVLLDRLQRVLVRPRSDGSLVAVVFLDLDQFKWVNDSHSHSAGDRLLIEVARRLEAAMRPSDTLARFGGDEFVVLCERLADETEVLAIVDRLTAALTEPMALEVSGELVADVAVTASIGVALGRPGEAMLAELLVRDADIAMYRAKERGRARYEIFDEAMRERATARLRTQNELRQALSNGELEVHFQPVVDPARGTVLGSEALVRWRHPERGLLLPDSFIPHAEETGLIVPLGEAVLATACAVTADWNFSRSVALTVAVNLSARQLSHPDLVDVVDEALRSSGLPPHLLVLEVTESVVMEDAEASSHLLGQLRALGVQIAIDDFGTGYSSMAYLLTLPVDYLKIDRSFVAATADGGPGGAIVSAVVALARTLGLGVIAEGVETVAQRDLLLTLEVEAAQGFLWGRAVPEQQAEWARSESPLGPGPSVAVPPARAPYAEAVLNAPRGGDL
jgi:diguanylate cyclase (GGDEF)-like protein